MNQNTYKLLIFCVLFVLFGFISTTILWPIIGADSGFYLKIAYDLHQGLSYYKDMNVSYNPLAIYFFSVVFDVFPGIPHYLLYIINIFLLLLLSVLFYSLTGFFYTGKQNRIFYTLLLFLSFFMIDGTSILLEPFVLFFQLFALLLILLWDKRNGSWYYLFGIGLCCFFAFYSKQYGISVVIAFTWFIYIKKISWKQFIMNLTCFGCGILVPALLIITYFYGQHIPVTEMLKRLTGIVYLAGGDKVTGLNYSFLKFLESIGRCVAEVPLLLILFYFIFKRGKGILSHTAILLILIIGSASIELIFAGYRHYYQLILPFCLLLIVYLIAHTPEVEKQKVHRLFTICCFLFLIISSYFLKVTLKERFEQYRAQKENATALKQIIPSGEKVYLQGINPSYYFLCLYDSPDHHLLSYRFPDELNASYISRSLPSGAFIILDTTFVNKSEFKAGFTQKHYISLQKGAGCLILKKD